jgi:hypothetical protein
VPDEVRDDAERALVDEAVTFGPKELGRLGERILEHVAPQLAEHKPSPSWPGWNVTRSTGGT